MPNNFLITGRPGSGKSTLVRSVLSALKAQGFTPGGLITPEIRQSGQRVGFKLIDLTTRTERILAHVRQPAGPRIGRYRVSLENLEFMTELSLERALLQADFLVIDEIGPMEVFSSRFQTAVLNAFSSNKPLLATIHQRTTTGFIGELKRRPDVILWEITPENRETVKSELINRLVEILRTPPPHHR